MSYQNTEEGSGILEKESEEKKEPKSEKKPEKLKKKALKSANDKLRDKLDHLDKLFQKKDKELTEQISKYAFLQAELENMRKYYVKQQNLTQSRTKANVITSFTPLIDSFEMAFNNQISSDIDGNGNCSPQLERYIKGFEGIRKQLSDIFESYQVKAIDTKNIPFDYKEHEVMMRVLNDNLPEDTIMQIVQKGYKMNGEVIRPAKVVVSKITPPPAPEPVKETMPPEVSSSEKKAPPVNSEEITEGNQEVQEQGSPEIPKTL